MESFPQRRRVQAFIVYYVSFSCQQAAPADRGYLKESVRSLISIWGDMRSYSML